MFDRSNYFNRLVIKYQGSEEEKQCAAILYNDTDIQMGDKRLNSIAALTWNGNSCQKIFAMLEKAIVPTENPWKVIYKALLIVHTNLLYGSELAVDKCIDLCKYIYPLQDYNSALVKKGFFNQGGVDYGGPVRAASRTVVSILGKDENIRKARQEARGGEAMLVPIGESFEQTKPSQGMNMAYGQVFSSSVGAGFGLEAVPGMYEGRPERYFDRDNDPRRNAVTTGDSQYTRDKQAPSLLDLVFDAPTTSANPNLPQADFLPALEKQKELERQLAEQQELLRKLQQQQLMQQQPPPQQYQPQHLQQPQQYQPPHSSHTPMQTKPNYSNDLLGLSMPGSYPPNPPVPSSMGYLGPHTNTNNAYNSYSNRSSNHSHDLLGMDDNMNSPAPMLGMLRPQQQSQSSMMNNNSMMMSPPSAGPGQGNETMYLENFHQQYQSRSIRYTESPINPNSPAINHQHQQPIENTGISGSTVSNYDATTQLWSFDRNLVASNTTTATTTSTNNPAPPPGGGYPSQYQQQTSYHSNTMMMSANQMPLGPPPDIPSGPPPPVPNFRP